jgi:hypothetical protein
MHQSHTYRFCEINIHLKNVFVATKAMQWATKYKQDFIVLFLEFEKAYDLMN